LDDGRFVMRLFLIVVRKAKYVHFGDQKAITVTVLICLLAIDLP